MRKYFYLLLFIVACYSKAYPQDSTLFYSATLLGAVSSPNVPLWVNANEYGAIPTKGSLYPQGQVFTEYIIQTIPVSSNGVAEQKQ